MNEKMSQISRKFDLLLDRQICEAATKGPWDAYYGCCNNRVNGGPHYNIIVAGRELRTEDATFIAAARSRWPAAMDEIENLKKQLDNAAYNICLNYGCPLTVYEGYVCDKYEDCPETIKAGTECWRELWRRTVENSLDSETTSKTEADREDTE